MNYARKLIRDNSPSSDHKNMKHILEESSLRDTLNGGIFVHLGSIDEEMIRKVQKQLFANNAPSNDARRMKIPPFNASRNDDSADMCIIFLRLIETEYV